MQPLLGLFLLSIFLTTGAGLQCETCTDISDTCSGNKNTCPSGADACVFLVTESKSGPVELKTAVKGCGQMSECKKMKGEVGKVFNSHTMGIAVGSLIKKVECNKAPVSSPSFLLALSGLLLMKFLF